MNTAASWGIVWSQIGSVVLWLLCFAGTVELLVLLKMGWNDWSESVFPLVVSGLLGWGAWALWP